MIQEFERICWEKFAADASEENTRVGPSFKTQKRKNIQQQRRRQQQYYMDKGNNSRLTT